MHTDYNFICAFYEIIKRYDYFEEKCRLGSFGKFQLDQLFLYVNLRDKTFFFDVEEKLIVGVEALSVIVFFRHFRDYGMNDKYLDYCLRIDNDCKLNALIAKELNSKLSPEYYELAKAAFHGFMALRSSNSHIFSINEIRELYRFSPVTTESTDDTEDVELNACIERAEALLNRKINFDNI
jgi:hypothetical protein